MILYFNKQYLPSVEAAMCDLENAEFEYEYAHKLEFGGYAGTFPNLNALERYRAARDRREKAVKIAREARMRELGRRLEVWA